MTTIYAFSTIPLPILYANSVTAIPLNVASCAVPPQHRKLFIGGLNHETTDEQLREYYSRWGNVVDCIVIRDPVSRHSRGFGFITYATTEMADAAMADRPHTIGGKVVDPKRAIPREQMLQAMNYPPSFLDMEPAAEYKLILSGIHWDFHTVDALRQHFEEFGDVEQVEIMANPRGYGFVVFEEREAVERCLASSRSHCINGRKIEIRESQPDEQWPIGSPPIIHHRLQRKEGGGGQGEDHHQKGTQHHQHSHSHNGHLKQQPYVQREHQQPLQPSYRRFGRPIGFGIGGSGMAMAHHQNGQQQIGGGVRIVHHHHGSLGSQGQGSQSHSPVDSLQSSEPESPINS